METFKKDGLLAIARTVLVLREAFPYAVQARPREDTKPYGSHA